MGQFNRSSLQGSVAEITAETDGWLATRAVPLEISNTWQSIGHHGRVGISRSTVYTTPEMVALEQRVLARHRHGLNQGSALLPIEAVQAAITNLELDLGSRLGDDQANAVRAICTSGHQYQAVQGLAGAGKTTAMRAAADAWSAQGYKKLALPRVIHSVGIVGPPSGGAGVTDPESILTTHAPHLTIRVYTTPTTGTNAPEGIARGIHLAATDSQLVLVCRGGGATADLAAYNHPAVITAIATCTVPVITGIGHANDHTHADTVAHTTTPTPTAAAYWLTSHHPNR